MPLTVAVIAQGAMGAGVAARLVRHGAVVLTSLAGRSAASARRAAEAGMQDVPLAQLARAELVLSILPPSEALALAETLLPVFAAAGARPAYADCNAISPDTVAKVAAVAARANCPFIDAGIIGGPPGPDGPGPAFYASGPEASRMAVLGRHGLDTRVIDGPVGAASALKMSYAGITKGFQALAAAMMLAASRAGAAPALHAELAASQPQLLAWFGKALPRMYDKAYRWAGEMDEIADFAAEDAATRAIYQGAGQLYEALAADHAGPGEKIAALKAFLAMTPKA
ncbi:MAG: DUF1932 domain-containing protein [Alphaproteobacteria bacterium]|nr:DUF1932 domain-containing protein [Alphaproteobacteria bacterium]